VACERGRRHPLETGVGISYEVAQDRDAAVGGADFDQPQLAPANLDLGELSLLVLSDETWLTSHRSEWRCP
jgi:hypothetical protein